MFLMCKPEVTIALKSVLPPLVRDLPIWLKVKLRPEQGWAGQRVGDKAVALGQPTCGRTHSRPRPGRAGLSWKTTAHSRRHHTPSPNLFEGQEAKSTHAENPGLSPPQ